MQLGSGCGCWKTPQDSEVGFGNSCLQSLGQECWGNSAAAAVCCSVHESAAALKPWKVRGEEISPELDSSGKRDGCAFLFCFVPLFFLKGRELLYERYFLLWC